MKKIIAIVLVLRPLSRRPRFVLPPVGASPLPLEEQTAPTKIVTCQNYCNLLLQFAYDFSKHLYYDVVREEARILWQNLTLRK